MSIKNFFSKKQNTNLRGVKIGIGKNTKNTKNTMTNNSVDDGDFQKNSPTQDVELTTTHSVDEKNVNLSTDDSTDDYFTNKFESIDEFESKLNQLASSNMEVNTLSPKEQDEEILFKMYKEENVESQTTNKQEHSDLDEIYKLGTALRDEEKKETDSLNDVHENFDKWSEKLSQITTGNQKDKEITRDSLFVGLDNETKNDLSGIFEDESKTIGNNNLDSIEHRRLLLKKEGGNRGGILSKISTKTQYTLLFTTLILSSIGVGSSLLLGDYASKKEAHASRLTYNLGGENQQFNSAFRESLIGVSGSYEKMMIKWKLIESLDKELKTTLESLSNSNLNTVYSDFHKNINKVSTNVAYLKSLENIIKNASEKRDLMNKGLTGVLELTEKIIDIYEKTGASQADISKVYILKSALETIKNSIANVLIGEVVEEESIFDLNKARDLFKKNLAEFYNSQDAATINGLHPGVSETYASLASNWLLVSSELDEILKSAADLTKAKQLLVSNQVIINNITSNLKEMDKSYNNNADKYATLYSLLLWLSIALLLVSVGALAYIYNFKKDLYEKDLEKESNKNKKAIYKLLKEMSPLQDGDLTQKTTVEEGITLDIADSINATIDSLSSVVMKIKNSSLVMREKTKEINLVSVKMLGDTEKQSDSIIDASDSINKIAKAITQISEKTKLSLITAQNSTTASRAGTQSVKDSIDSMNIISKNMDETVHLMSKVSDSSTQISEVIGLLSDITEETNILALNATVQAAKAGESGKGFKIVADSIQELADNAAEATRRVGALIATVQTDIQSVGSSIERTTQEVQRGVELSSNAGKSLDEITIISNELAEIVKVISIDANTNAESARQISNRMSQILEITEETKNSAKQTTTSLGEIDNMSSDLSESVKSFITQ